MKSPLYCLILAASLQVVVITAQEWWRTATFYQVYPRSFKDNSNDGIGDLKGITSKVDYLAEIGIDAIWINPIYPSPMVDFGYDISDYKNIDPVYGSMDDLKELIKELHNKNIKIVLDFVPNHSSWLHPWFNRSINMEGNYTDYYVWRNGISLGNGTMVPPNNWQSVFGGSAWTWNEVRKQYYLHQFYYQQPDLNFRNSEVLREMKEITELYLDLGIDGIRVDAAKYMVEDELFRDEPFTNKTSIFTDQGRLDHIYTQNQNLTYEIVRMWGELVKNRTLADGKDRVMLMEVYDSLENMLTYTGGPDQPFVIPFNILFVFTLKQNTIAPTVASVANGWIDSMPKYSVANWQVGNHDNGRIATKVGPELVDAMNMMMAMLPGIMVTYNGEELGMTDTYLTDEQKVSGFRDPARTPFQWDDAVNAGFCGNAKPWLPVNPNYWWLNVAAQKSAAKSHLKVYQSLMKLRKAQTLSSNTSQHLILAPNNDTLGILRWAVTGDKYLLIINFGSYISAPLTRDFLSLFDIANHTEFIVNITSLNSGYNDGDQITTSIGLNLRPKSAVILQIPFGVQSSAAPTSGQQSSTIIFLYVIVVPLFLYVVG